MEALEEEVQELKGALLGTLGGRPGLYAQLEHVTRVSEHGVSVSERNSEQLESLRLDRAKVLGIVIAVSVLWGAFLGVYKLIYP